MRKLGWMTGAFFAGSMMMMMMTGSAHAAASGEHAGWLGATGGLSVPNYDNTTARTALGITAGAKLGSEYGVGAYYRTSAKDEAGLNGVTFPFNYDLYGVMAGYFFEGDAKGAYFGAMIGMTKVTSKPAVGGTNYDASTSPMHWGLVGGYDYFIGDHLSLGAELSYVSVGNSTAATAGGTWAQSAFSTLNFNGALKFWF